MSTYTTPEGYVYECLCLAPGESSWKIPDECRFSMELHNDNMTCLRKVKKPIMNKDYDELQLRWLWNSVKDGMKKTAVMKELGISSDEAIAMYDAAHKLWGRTPKVQPKHIVHAPEEQKKFERPPAKYDNKSCEELIDELLKLDI